jgi:hypothetical protein
MESATWDEDTRMCPVPLDTNHSGLVKFYSRADPNYMKVLVHLRHIVSIPSNN